MQGLRDIIKTILDRENIAYITTSNGMDLDSNAVISYAADDELNLYFASGPEALKSRNMRVNAQVTVTVANLRIQGMARHVARGSADYDEKTKVYGDKFPLYAHVFERENNELYVVRPQVIWHYDPVLGEKYMDKLVLNKKTNE